MEVIEAIKTRRSIGRMSPEVPPRDVIEKVIEAAVEAPNHHNTEPWRFYVLTGAARERLGEVMAERLKRAWYGDENKLEAGLMAERAKPLRSPVVVVVGVKHSENERIDAREDLQAASAGIQNLLLAAHSLGLTTVWRTGEGVYDDGVKAHFGLSPRDEIAGMVYLGYPDAEAAANAMPRSRATASFTEWRDGSN
jgi:nitroreductase